MKPSDYDLTQSHSDYETFEELFVLNVLSQHTKNCSDVSVTTRPCDLSVARKRRSSIKNSFCFVSIIVIQPVSGYLKRICFGLFGFEDKYKFIEKKENQQTNARQEYDWL